ncbi:MAG: hypothetical protein FWD95_01870 [Nocardioidaceae bacterium]|nr:hypothetical protein [Nocardioidaceae bacterium]
MTTCRFVASDQPRALVGRHDDDCADRDCRGCQPCPEDHCTRCGREHVRLGLVCPGCIGDARDDLRAIRDLCDALPAEVEHRGIDSEAMNLLGPVADPESVGHVRASINVGRIDAGWLETADDERHPLLVLGGWWQAYAEALDHTEPGRITVSDAREYLDRHLYAVAQLPDVPFADLARDLAGCRRHLERVLHDGEQVETGAPCMTCRVPLRLVRGGQRPARRSESGLSRTRGSHPGSYANVIPNGAQNGADDFWYCPRCRETSTEDQYRFAVAHLHRESAEWLTAQEMEIRTGVKLGTVRVWATRGLVRKRRDSERTVFAVADVTRQAGLLDHVAGAL